MNLKNDKLLDHIMYITYVGQGWDEQTHKIYLRYLDLMASNPVEEQLSGASINLPMLLVPGLVKLQLFKENPQFVTLGSSGGPLSVDHLWNIDFTRGLSLTQPSQPRIDHFVFGQCRLRVGIDLLLRVLVIVAGCLGGGDWHGETMRLTGVTY